MLEHVEPKPKTVKIPGPDHPTSAGATQQIAFAPRFMLDARFLVRARVAFQSGSVISADEPN